MYNLTKFDEVNHFGDLFKTVNDLSEGKFIALFLFAFWLIVIIVFRNQADLGKIMIADSFVVLLIGLVAWAGGFMSQTFLIIPLLLLVASIVFHFISNKN